MNTNHSETKSSLAEEIEQKLKPAGYGITYLMGREYTEEEVVQYVKNDTRSLIRRSGVLPKRVAILFFED